MAEFGLKRRLFPQPEMNCQREEKEEKGVHSESLNIFGAGIRFFLSSFRRRFGGEMSAARAFRFPPCSFLLIYPRFGSRGFCVWLICRCLTGDVYGFPFWNLDF